MGNEEGDERFQLRLREFKGEVINLSKLLREDKTHLSKLKQDMHGTLGKIRLGMSRIGSVNNRQFRKWLYYLAASGIFMFLLFLLFFCS